MLQIGVAHIFAQGPYDPEQDGYTDNADMFAFLGLRFFVTVFIIVLLFLFGRDRYEDQKRGWSPNTTPSSPTGARKSNPAASASRDRKGNAKAKAAVKTASRPAAKSGAKRAVRLTPEQQARHRAKAAKQQARANYLAELKKRAIETPTKTVRVKPQDIKRHTPEQQAKRRANAAKQQAQAERLARLKERAEG